MSSFILGFKNKVLRSYLYIIYRLKNVPESQNNFLKIVFILHFFSTSAALYLKMHTAP